MEEIGTLDFSFVDNKKQYYTLRSVEDAADKAYIPTEDESNIRRPVSREEALTLIGRMPQIEELEIKNEKFREQEYRQCIADFCPENWVRVLKTTYNRKPDEDQREHHEPGPEVPDDAGACPVQRVRVRAWDSGLGDAAVYRRPRGAFRGPRIEKINKLA